MKKYIKPIMEVELFVSSDIFTTSGNSTKGNYGGTQPGDKEVTYDFSNDAWGN